MPSRDEPKSDSEFAIIWLLGMLQNRSCRKATRKTGAQARGGPTKAGNALHP